MPPLRSTGPGPEADHPEYAGQYLLESTLGSGGMGVVHLAASASGLRLAVKVVHAQHAKDPEFRARFRQEVSAARRVSGAFTASVVDADPTAARPWMATLYIPGPTLAEEVKLNGPLAPSQVRRLGAGLAEALRDIHRAGVVHRDLKPSNVLLAADGPKVIDFGISRPYDSDLRTETGKLIGTPPFMAPEQFQSPREVGPAADVFAMGAVLVHAATGNGPFDSESHYIVAYQVVHNEPDLTGVPDDLVPLLRSCLAKKPEDRPTPDELMAELRSAAYGTEAFIPTQRFRNPVEKVPGRPWPGGEEEGSSSDVPTHKRAAAEPVPAPGRARRPLRWVAAGAALVAVVAGGVLGVRMGAGGDGDSAPPTGPAGQVARRADAFTPWAVPLAGGGGGNRTPACSFAGADRALYCAAPGVTAARLDPANGHVVWSVKAKGAAGRVADDGQPRVSGGLVLVAPPGAGRVEALDPATGATRWSRPVPAHAALAIGDTSVVFTADSGEVRCLDSATGKERWRGRPAAATAQWVAAPGGTAWYAVSVAEDAATSLVTAVAPNTGKVLWTKRLPGSLGPVGVAGGALALLAADADSFTTAVVRLDTATRAVRRTPLPAPVDQAQATVADDGSRVYVFGAGGSLLAVDAGRGAQLWRLETGAARASRPVAGGGRVYVTASDGRLLAVDAGRGVLVGQTAPRMASGRDTFAASLGAPVVVGAVVYGGAPDGAVFGVGVGALAGRGAP
ncbi:PQQ-binding-like beta-propeller repeat protein [Streptomyces sp. TLI_146]|uniref:serine/threonine-protein kinase n=1 Tax=Streptomyces sp. TLI_146 TaxID=1938858 RepID=UPI000C70C63F|nr:serine/threonine-protein kinase [Streptomyces sp. TLI_146]PKV87100.1 serine/threonine protein kinase [Streptomyces sp. TLI_146]